jgi:hypothetical protein
MTCCASRERFGSRARWIWRKAICQIAFHELRVRAKFFGDLIELAKQICLCLGREVENRMTETVIVIAHGAY